MGALSNSGRKAANLAGFYKAFQSAGAAVLWALDGRKMAYNTIFGITVCLILIWEMQKKKVHVC